MTKSVSLSVVFLLAALGLVGCGGDDGGLICNGDGGFGCSNNDDDGGVDEGGDISDATTLGKVTDAQANALCHALVKDLRKYMAPQDLVEFSCVFDSLRKVAMGMVDQSKAACDAAAETCIMTNANPPDYDETICDNPNNVQLVLTTFASNACEAYTVGESRACVATWLAGQNDAFDVYSCELADHIEDATAVDAMYQQTRLGDLTDKCFSILNSCVGPAFTVENLVPMKPTDGGGKK